MADQHDPSGPEKTGDHVPGFRFDVPPEVPKSRDDDEQQASPPPKSAAADTLQPPVRWREILAVLAMVALCDATIYRGAGYAGYALLFAAAPALLLLGAFRPRLGWGLAVVGFMLAVLSAKLLWCGSLLLAGAGFVLLVAFAMTLSGLCPYVLEVMVFASQTVLAGYDGLSHHGRSLKKHAPSVGRANWLAVLLPVAAFLAFGVLFILANPDLLASFGETLERVLNALREWIIELSPEPTEVLFWLGVLWLTVGLLRPAMKQTLFEETSPDGAGATGDADGAAPTPLYAAFRNTLLTVIVLFAVYLVFEFATLWFREFPKGFHYSGYAHEGAAWLTVALALATVILSVVFRGSVLGDRRLPRLRRLAWIWSLENMLLAVAVYHRLGIYIGFNGMTRMRTVGIFGISTVVAGFILVLWKIARNRDFIWLMRRQLWALALAVYLFALTPVDTIVVSYNVRRILSGDWAPSVQISVHPISSEGVLLLEPLLDCDNETIRQGVAALLAQRHAQAEAKAERRRDQGWTAYQLADEVVLRGLRAASGKWTTYTDRAKRQKALEALHDYAYQWF
ncbi:MAG: DUF4153 domain-containing protein [Planctomycetota bacterium]|jgi:hypothetical protein